MQKSDNYMMINATNKRSWLKVKNNGSLTYCGHPDLISYPYKVLYKIIHDIMSDGEVCRRMIRTLVKGVEM